MAVASVAHFLMSTFIELINLIVISIIVSSILGGGKIIQLVIARIFVAYVSILFIYARAIFNVTTRH